MFRYYENCILSLLIVRSFYALARDRPRSALPDAPWYICTESRESC